MAGRFIYVISGDHGRQKIGVTDDPQQRIRDLQTGSPFPLTFEFLGITNDTAYAIESEVHFLLARHRQSGEWFAIAPEMAIAAVMATARRLGHSIKPVDPDNLPAAAIKARDVQISTETSWKLFGVCLLLFFALLALTDHFLTALIVSLSVAKLSEISIRHLVPHLPAIKAAIARHNLRRSQPSATRGLRISR